MTQNATAEVFRELLALEGRSYTYDGVSREGIPSGLEPYRDNDLETVAVKVELIRVLRSAWGDSGVAVGKAITDFNDKERRVVDIDDDGSSDTFLLIVSVD